MDNYLLQIVSFYVFYIFAALFCVGAEWQGKENYFPVNVLETGQ